MKFFTLKISLMIGAIALVTVAQPTHADSVKSIGRAVSAEFNGEVVQQRTINCSDKQSRIIYKPLNSRRWCYGVGDRNCFRDKLVAAKKACRAPAVNVVKTANSTTLKEALAAPVDHASKVDVQLPDAATESMSTETSQGDGQLTDMHRKALLQELTEINARREEIRLKLRQIEDRLKSLLGDEVSLTNIE